jgi:hypothetical protein
VNYSEAEKPTVKLARDLNAALKKAGIEIAELGEAEVPK